MSWEERIPPLRAALLQPVDRNETYSASALYAAALVRELLPEIARRAPHGRRIGMGASLGALAMLHAHVRHPRRFDGAAAAVRQLLPPALGQESSRASAATRGSRASSATVLRGGGAERPIPVALTCGTAEENRANNRRDGRGARRAGLPGLARGGARRAQLDLLARRVRPAPAGVDRGGGVMQRRRSRSTAATCSPTATTAGRWSRSRPRTARCSDWEDRGMVDGARRPARRRPDEALLRAVLRQRELDAP